MTMQARTVGSAPVVMARGAESDVAVNIQLFGLAVSRGVAIGRAVLIASSRVDVAHYFIDENQVTAEIARLRLARDTVAAELSALKLDLAGDTPTELAALLDVHLMLLHDETLVDATKQWVVDRRYNAEWALSAQLEVVARQFDEMEDGYLRERKADVEQVVERLLLVMRKESAPWSPFPAARLARGDGSATDESLVLVANDVAPADMMQFKRSVFTGFITEVGGVTSHTAIVARSLDIPAVIGAREASRIVRHDDCVVVDGDVGIVIVNPSPTVLEQYRARQRQAASELVSLVDLTGLPAVTLDGEAVELLANIESPADAGAAIAAGAAGVGLYRSEFLFMNRNGELPQEDEQFEAYKAAVEAMRGRPVTIRTVDIGADKALDRLSLSELRRDHLLNPALGLRAIRWSLSEPAMFRQQLRAILRASAFGPVKLLIPMVAQRSEARGTFDALRRARAQLEDAGKPYGRFEVGAMIEIPAAALSLDWLLELFDFVSIGTNDLIQYTLAIDRSDESVAHLYDPWHPAVLKLIAQTIAGARQANKRVSVCGEMAGDPQFTELLLGMGLRSFSMHPAQIARIKRRVLASNARRWAEALPFLLASDDPQAYASSLASP